MQFIRENKLAWGCALVLLCGLLFIGAMFSTAEIQAQAVWKGFIVRTEMAAQAEARQTDQSLDRIYESLRTIAFLPGVKTLYTRHDVLPADTRDTAQQIYNSLATSSAISEIYITQVGFNPKKLDSVTGAFEVPNTILDKFNEQSNLIAENKTDANVMPQLPTTLPGGLGTKFKYGDAQEEYRHIVKQIEWLQNKYHNTEFFRGKSVPIIASEEFITGDNSVYQQSHKDDDRRGISFSVPYYSIDGNLLGVVSAIFRSESIRAFQSQPEYSLTSFFDGYASNDHLSFNGKGANWRPSLFASDADLHFAVNVRVFKHDPRGGWLLQRNYKTSDFYLSEEFRAIQSFAFWSAFLIVLATGLVIAQFILMRYREMLIIHRATHDGLTGLPNRSYLELQLKNAIQDVENGKVCTVIYLDLDRFKVVNDTLGHHAGDLVLKVSADRMIASVRDKDLVSRLGGDEFVILLREVSELEVLQKVVTRIIEEIASPILFEGREIRVGASIGITIIADGLRKPKDILRHADLALFRSKRAGRGGYSMYEPRMDTEAEDQRILEIDLGQALAKNELAVHYQPIIDLVADKVEGFEALLRWNHPTHGLVPPSRFIPVAENNGQIDAIGDWVIEQVCLDMASFPKGYRVAINLSPVQLLSPSFPLRVLQIAKQHRVALRQLEFEITENVKLEQAEIELSCLHQLRSAGARIILDDFGVGYSSFSYLKHFNFDGLKIDRSFLEDIERPEQSAILRAIVDLSRGLNLSTTIEGIETAMQLNIVRQQGCTKAQGFFFGKPMAREELFFTRQRSRSSTR